MGGAKSSGSAGAGGAVAATPTPPARRPDEKDPELSRSYVDVYRDPAQYEEFKRLEPLVTKLKTAMSREGIPSYQMNASRMVTGYSSVGSSGVRVSLGRPQEMAAIKQEANTLDRRGRQSGVRQQMFARYPTRVYVDARHAGRASTEGASERRASQTAEWYGKIRAAGEAIGLRWHEPSSDFSEPYFD